MPATNAPTKKLSVLKRARQNIKRQARNTAVRTELKTLTKKLITAVEAKEKEPVEQAMKGVERAYRRATGKGVVHGNTASRKISRLSKLSNQVLRPSTD